MRLTTPEVSARTACHSTGSALPFVGKVLTRVCRLARAKLTRGGSFFRNTPQTITPANPKRSKAQTSFFTFSS